MFKVETPEGPKYMVVLTGPKSYRFGDMHVYRGGTLTVSKRTRDYLVKKTGYFSDYDPTPSEPVEELFPPQFGEIGGPSIDLADFDPKANPALTQAQAAQLVAQMGGTVTDQHGNPVASGPVALDDPEGTEKGDLTVGDLPDRQTKGGATASTAMKPTTPAKPSVATKKPKTEEPAKTGGAIKMTGAETVS